MSLKNFVETTLQRRDVSYFEYSSNEIKDNRGIKSMQNLTDFNQLWHDPNFINFNNNTLFHDRALSQNLFATAMWQNYITANSANEKVIKVPASSGYRGLYGADINGAEKIVVSIGDGRYAILLLDPFYFSETPLILDISSFASDDEILHSYRYWRNKLSRYESNLSPLNRNTIKALETSITPDLLIEYKNKTDWPVIVCRAPRMEFTESIWHTNSSHGVKVNGKPGANTLAGIYGFNRRGQFGATICLHTFPNHLNGSFEGEYVEVNGVMGKVVTSHLISDSCFVSLPENAVSKTALQLTNGPLTGISPRQNELAFFVNRNSERITTLVNSWSLEILNPQPFAQAKIYTEPDSNPGDSGSALIDNEGKVLGFAFQRTGINERPAFSSWMWAQSVFNYHDIIY